MTKLFLMKSKSEENNSGDVIVDLDKFFTYRIFIMDNKKYRLIADYTNEDGVICIFDNLEDARQMLKKIFLALGQDVSLADAIEPIKSTNKNREKLAEILNIMQH